MSAAVPSTMTRSELEKIPPCQGLVKTISIGSDPFTRKSKWFGYAEMHLTKVASTFVKCSAKAKSRLAE